MEDLFSFGLVMIYLLFGLGAILVVGITARWPSDGDRLQRAADRYWRATREYERAAHEFVKRAADK